LADEPIDRIERVLELLTAFGHDANAFELSPGLGRGLHYYTGMLFEIYDGNANQGQLVGGGRYDELAQTLGARQALPACGFTYGLERIVDALPDRDGDDRNVTLIAPAVANAMMAAIKVAEQLRAQGQMIELDVRGRSVSANRRYAQRAGMSALIVVSADGTYLIETLHEAERAAKETAGE